MPCLYALGIMNPDPLHPWYPLGCWWDYGPSTDKENQLVLWQAMELSSDGSHHWTTRDFWMTLPSTMVSNGGLSKSKGFLDSTLDLEEGGLGPMVLRWTGGVLCFSNINQHANRLGFYWETWLIPQAPTDADAGGPWAILRVTLQFPSLALWWASASSM